MNLTKYLKIPEIRRWSTWNLEESLTTVQLIVMDLETSFMTVLKSCYCEPILNRFYSVKNNVLMDPKTGCGESIIFFI